MDGVTILSLRFFLFNYIQNRKTQEKFMGYETFLFVVTASYSEIFFVPTNV